MKLVEKRGIIRAADAAAAGIPWVYVRRLYQQGRLQQIARGLYRSVGEDTTAQHGLVLVALKSPRATISLLSALGFHGLTTQVPQEVWMTIGHNEHPPKLAWPTLQVTHSSGKALSSGIESHDIEGVTVRVYSPAKTVADCFKFRNKVGLDVALEALREYRRLHRGGLDDLERFARICRVSRVMRPYLEALLS
jgi:predicted transcriptional regulator of viral defense system